MVVFAAFFDKTGSGITLAGQQLAHARRTMKDFDAQLKTSTRAAAYFLGRDNAQQPVFTLGVKAADIGESRIALTFEKGRKTDIQSAAAVKVIRRIAARRGWADPDGLAPLVVLLDEAQARQALADMRRAQRMERRLIDKDYKGLCMMFAPLRTAKQRPEVWDDPDTLYALGLACSKLAVTLLVKAGEKKKLETARQYREYAAAFLGRGAEIETDNARFATALAYRYYSNVHELMRPGERRDGDLDMEMQMANEWLSKAIEMNPQSVRNHYRKGKLIIEKQAPYLLFGKKAFGSAEASLLREIRQVGEEHLATAISLFEALEDEESKAANRREYAKALYVLGRHYLDDANPPVREVYFRKMAGSDAKTPVEKICKLDLESAKTCLEKCWAAETDMALEKPDPKKLVRVMNDWTRTPVEKLYAIGCVYGASAFVNAAEGRPDKAQALGQKALALLDAAKRTADAGTDRKRNTWHISEKMAWVHIYLGDYLKAARLLERARSGYVLNTYATALLLEAGAGDMQKAEAALKKAAAQPHNLAADTSRILLAFVRKSQGKPFELDGAKLPPKPMALGRILGVAGHKRHL